MGHAASVFDCVANPLHKEEDEDYCSGDEAGTLTVQDFTPLRDSRLWALSQAYYARMGLRAWAEGSVPNFVTSNSFIARAYAKVLAGALWDAARAAPCGTLRGQPVHILEVGSGHGKLAYLIVDALLGLQPFLPPLGSSSGAAAPAAAAGAAPAPLPFRYIVTDPLPGNLAAIRAHPRMAKLAALGALDFAVFDALGSAQGVTLQLEASGAALQAPLAHPLLVVANYVLDSLPTDAFHISPGGALSQVTVALNARARVAEGEEGEGEEEEEEEAGAAQGGEAAAARRAAAAAEVQSMDMVKVRWARQALALPPQQQPDAAPAPDAAGEEGAALLAPQAAAAAAAAATPPSTPSPATAAALHASVLTLGEPYASSPFLRQLLVAYALSASPLRAAGGIVLLPLGGFQLLERLQALSGGRALVLLGDKGHSTLAEMCTGAASREHPHLAEHGSVSVMVNFHALRAWVRARGGHVLSTPYAEGFKVCAAYLGAGEGAGAQVRGVCSGSSASSASGSSAAAASGAAAVALREAADAAAAEASVLQYCRTGALPEVGAASGRARAGGALPWYPPATFGAGALAAARLSVAEAAPEGSGGEAAAGAAAAAAAAQPRPPATPVYEPQEGGFLGDDDLVAPLAAPQPGGSAPLPSASPAPPPRLLAAWASSLLACAEVLGGLGLAPDDFAVLQRGVRDEVREPSLSTCLTLLRLAGHDADVFLKFRGVLQAATEGHRGGAGGAPAGEGAGAAAPHAPRPGSQHYDSMLRDLRDDLDRVYSAYYPLQASKDVCFELARILMNLHEYGAALRNFRRSRAHCGAHHVTAHNEGLCHYYLGDAPAAVACFRESLALCPHYAEAAGMLAKVETELLSAGGGSLLDRGGAAAEDSARRVV